MEMYQNLSGLSITGVRSIMEGDLYTCVQTGKRGSKCIESIIQDMDVD